MLELRHVHKAFRDRTGGTLPAVKDFSLSVKPGEFVSLVGPSGCGKTTLLRMIAGLETADDTSILFNGHSVASPHRERGMVFQNFVLFPWMSVEENIASGLKFAGMPLRARRAIVDRYLTLTGLTAFAKAYPHTLSGGMKQRVAIARTLANDPQIILMDEPFAALDVQTRSQMQEFLADLWETEHKTVIFVTHDIEEAIFLSDRVLLLTHRPSQVKKEFAVPFARPRMHALKLQEDFFRLKREVTELL